MKHMSNNQYFVHKPSSQWLAEERPVVPLRHRLTVWLLHVCLCCRTESPRAGTFPHTWSSSTWTTSYTVCRASKYSHTTYIHNMETFNMYRWKVYGELSWTICSKCRGFVFCVSLLVKVKMSIKYINLESRRWDTRSVKYQMSTVVL